MSRKIKNTKYFVHGLIICGIGLWIFVNNLLFNEVYISENLTLCMMVINPLIGAILIGKSFGE